MSVVYDTSGILHAIDLDFCGFITPRVFNEIKDEILLSIVKRKLNNGELKILIPSLENIEKVKKLNEKISDNLSETDIEVVAAALQYNLKIITNDFAIQNISKILQIPFEGTDKNTEIEKVYIYENICIGCEKKYPKPKRKCKICGADVVKVPVKSEK